MFPEQPELLLIGYSIVSIWTPKSKSNTLTPKTNSQTYWPREISHVMNGIIFCVCSTLAISVLSIVLKWWRKERKKIQVKKRVTAKSKPMMNLVSRCSEKDSWHSCLYCIRKPGENQTWKSTTSELMEWAASKNKETCFRRLLIKLLRVIWWEELVFSRVEIWWIDGS